MTEHWAECHRTCLESVALLLSFTLSNVCLYFQTLVRKMDDSMMLRCCNAMTFWQMWNVPMESPDKMSPIFCASCWPKALRCVAESELHGSHAAPSNLVISPFAFSKHQFSESISPVSPQTNKSEHATQVYSNPSILNLSLHFWMPWLATNTCFLCSMIHIHNAAYRKPSNIHQKADTFRCMKTMTSCPL